MDFDTKKTVGSHIEDGALMPIIDAIRDASNSELKAIAEITDLLKSSPDGETLSLSGSHSSLKGVNASLFEKANPEARKATPYKREDIAPIGAHSSPQRENLSPSDTMATPGGVSAKSEDHAAGAPESDVAEEFGRSVSPIEKAGSFVVDELEDDTLNKNLGGMTAQLADLLKATEKLAEKDEHSSTAQQSQTEVHHAPSHPEVTEAGKSRPQKDDEPVINLTPAADGNSATSHNTTIDNSQSEAVITPADRTALESSEVASSTTATEHQQTKELVSASESVAPRSQAEKEPRDPYRGYWQDDRGQLRHPTGRFASKDEKDGFTRSQKAKEANDKEKELSLIGKLVKGAGNVAQGIHSFNNGSVEEASAVAAGGSYTYAAKELFDLGSNTVEQVKNAKEKITDFSETQRAKKAAKAEQQQQKQTKKANKTKRQQNKKAIKADKDRIRQTEAATTAEAEKAKTLNSTVNAEKNAASSVLEQVKQSSSVDKVSDSSNTTSDHSGRSESEQQHSDISSTASQQSVSNNEGVVYTESGSNHARVSESVSNEQQIASAATSSDSAEHSSIDAHSRSNEQVTTATALEQRSDDYEATQSASDVSHVANSDRVSSVEQVSNTAGIEKASESVSASEREHVSQTERNSGQSGVSLHVENLTVDSAVVEHLKNASPESATSETATAETVKHEQSSKEANNESVSVYREAESSDTAINSQRHDSNTSHDSDSVVAEFAERSLYNASESESTTATDIRQQDMSATESVSDIASVESQRLAEKEHVSQQSPTPVEPVISAAQQSEQSRSESAIVASQSEQMSDVERTASESGHDASQHETTTGNQSDASASVERISVDTATIESATLDESAKADPVPGSQSESKTEKAIEESQQQEGLEVLREQSAEDVIYHAEMIKQADEIVSAIKGVDVASGSGGGSPLDSIGELASDLFDRDGSKRKGGRKGKKGSRARTLRDKLSKRKPTNPASVVESASKNPVKRNKSFSLDYKQGAKGGGMLSKLGGGLKTLGKGGALAGLFAGIDKIMEVKDRDDLSNSQKGAQVASTAVGAGGGAIAGGMAGAALGTMILPGIGTAVGGFIGSALGGMGGDAIGSTIGESISNFMGSDKSFTESISSLWGGSASPDEGKTADTKATSPKKAELPPTPEDIAMEWPVVTAPDSEKAARELMAKREKSQTETEQFKENFPVAVEAKQQRTVETNQSIRQMEQANQRKEETSVVTLDARSTAALEKLAQLGGNNTSTTKNPPQNQTAPKASPQGGESGIPADFTNEYMRAVALDLD